MAGRVPVATKAEQFMVSPLVVWLNTFDDYNAVKNVQDLADGILLHKVMYTIDPANCSMTKVHRSVSHDQGLRMENLQLLVERIKNFYFINMQQLIITSLPNIVSICSSPASDYSLDQMEKLMILLLGCAVKCEPLIEKMKAMDPIQQQAIVTNIKQVTHSTEMVCSIDWDDLNEIPKQALQGLCRIAYSHLQRVAKERDAQYDTIIEISLEKDWYKQLQQSSSGGGYPSKENGISSSHTLGTPPRGSPAINTEMLELKKKGRHLQEQLDHKSNLVVDSKEEVEKLRSIIQKLQQDKRELAEDAKSARAYRDEIEILKVQDGKLEKLEADVSRYRQKAEDTEYLKKKIAGLKTENDLTIQTKALLEQKIEALTSRSEALDDLQEEYASTKAQMESLQQEKEMDSEKIEELLSRNAHLEIEFKHYEERIAQLNMELETTRASALEANSTNDASNLSFEMSEADMTSKAKVMRLEKEAREMEKSMESLRHSQAKCVELEKINKKLHSQTHSDRRDIIKLREEVEVLKVKASRVDKLQVELNTQRERVEESGRNSSKLKEMKTKYDIILEAKAKLEDEVDSLQSKVVLTDRLKDENASLKAQADSFTTGHDEDQKRIQELLEQNAQLELEKQICSEEMETLKSQLLQLRNKSGPQAPIAMVSPPRYSEAEMASKAKLKRLEKETQEMEKTMEALRHTQAKCSELEKGSKKLMEQTHVDRKVIIKLTEQLQSSKAKLERMEKLQIEMKNQEHQLEDMDAAKRKITELKQQNSLLSEARILLHEEMTGLQAKLEKYSSSQADNVALQVRVEAMEMELQDESLRMQELLQQNVQLELDRDKVNEELKSRNEEILQLKLNRDTESMTISPVHKPMNEDDLANLTKLLRLERDNRELERSLDVERLTNQRTGAEMEKISRKLTATIHADKKEIARLKEELRRERASQHSGVARLKSVSEETDFDQTKQVQELENKFKDAYSHNLSTKDERIQVLEKRVDETIRDNTQLREDLVTLRKQNERLRSASPRSSPFSPRENSDSIKMKEKVTVLQEENALLTTQMIESKQVMAKLEASSRGKTERNNMLEKLNYTLDEEKKHMHTRMTELYEQNKKLLEKTLETKDMHMEDERLFNDRLGEMEREKQRLQEQLAAQRRDTLSKDMEYWKKGGNNKSKNILKKGIKKLKGKLQGKSHEFAYTDGMPPHGIAGSHTIGAVGSVGSIGSSGSGGNLNIGYHRHDGSMSSSQSISSSNSKQSEEQEEEVVDPASVTDNAAGGFVPRNPTFDGSSPFLRPRKNRASVNLPGFGDVKLRHGSNRPHTHFGHPVSTPNLDSSRIPDDLMSLEDFLAESDKTPNRRRFMELKRASLVIGTPPSTPRNSLLISSSNANQIFDLQEFLSNVDPNDARSQRNTIHEVEENDFFIQEQVAEHRASQQSISQHSKSSSSLHSAPSLTSMNRGESQDSTGVIANPAALAGNFNNSNNNNNGDSGGAGGPNSRKGFSQDQTTLFSSFGSSRVDGVRGDANNGVSSTRDTGEKGGIVSSTPDKPAVSWNASTINNCSSESSNKNLTRSNSNSERHSVVVVTTDESAETSVNHRRTSGGQSLFRKAFHQSSNDVILESQHDNDSGKPPLGRNKVHKSTDGLNQGGGNGRKGKKEGKRLKPFKGLDLSDLTKLNHTTGGTITIHNNKAPPRMSKGGGGGGGGKGAPPATHYHLQPPRIQDGQKMISIKASSQPESKRDSTTTSSQSTSQESDELLSLEDFLGGIGGGGGGGGGSNITHHHSPSAHSRQGKSPPPPSNTSSRSDGDDWLEYGSV